MRDVGHEIPLRAEGGLGVVTGGGKLGDGRGQSLGHGVKASGKLADLVVRSFLDPPPRSPAARASAPRPSPSSRATRRRERK